MKKYYFALCCVLMAATCAMAAPQSGDRIMAAQIHAVEWNDVTLRPTVDEVSFSLGYKTQLSQSADDNVLILSGLCDMFDIPVHVDYTTGKAWIETGMPLDAYTDQYNRVVVRTIYVLPEQCLADAEADMNANLYGSILEDGSIAFDGGIVFLVSESTDVQDLATAGDASETVWMSSPLFRDMRLLVPNAIHQFRVDNEAYKSVSKPKPGFDELTEVTKMTTVRNGLIDIIHGGFRPSKPNGPPPVCKPGSGNDESAAAPDGNSTLNKHKTFFGIPDNGGGYKPKKPERPTCLVVKSDVKDASDVQSADLQGTLNAVNTNPLRFPNGGVKPKQAERPVNCNQDGPLPPQVGTLRPDGNSGQIVGLRPFVNVGDLSEIKEDSAGVRPMPPTKPRPCGPDDEVATPRTPVDVVVAFHPFNGDDFPWDVIVIVDSAGRKPIKPSGPLHGCSEDPLGGQVAFSRTPGGQVASAPNHDNDNIEAGVKPHKDVPPTRGCSEPPIWLTLMQMAGFPTRDNSNTSVASSKPADEEFSVPVYVLQNPDDNTITVYNLYGSGYVMTCTIAPEERKPSIADVTELIDHLLTAGNDDANQAIDDVNQDGKINIDDVTTMIDTLLNAAD